MQTLAWFTVIQGAMLVSSPLVLLGCYMVGLVAMVVWSER